MQVNIGAIFDTVFMAPVVNLLVVILQALQSWAIPGALGFSIIVLTVAIRALVWPLMASQLKSAKKMADLKPRLDELKNKHKDDKQALAAAQMALYKSHGVNPAGGCLPTLVQLPVLIALYQAVLALFSGADGVNRLNSLLYFPSWKLNSPPDPNFFGLNIAQKPAEFATVGMAVLLVPLVTGLLTFLQSKMMTPKPVKAYPSDSPQEKQEKAKEEDTMSAVQTQMMFMMPIMIGYFSFQFPIALALYWNTLTVVGMVQQYLVSGWGGLESLLGVVKK